MEQKQTTLRTEIGPDGREQASAPLENTGCADNLLYISPRQAIPIVFVPGIMGTPLLATGKNKNLVKKLEGRWSWFPDSLGWMGVKSLVGGFNRLTPAEKKALLDPDQTKVPRAPGEADFSGFDLDSCPLPKAEIEKRGWGTVLLSDLGGYGPILSFLEAELKNLYHDDGKNKPRIKGAMLAFEGSIQAIKGYQALDLDAYKKASSWSYPVYACGYNWLRSNEESADDLASYIQFVLNDCRTRLQLKCDNVILVTHSMGGLVGRRCAQKHPKNILGVVHGVQPAIGAGTAYRRVRAGWEDWKGRMAIGANADEVTPVFAAPGPLQLLPNQLYGNGWLNVRWEKENGPLLMSMPKANNPYDEIYSKTTAWWRLCDPRLVEPRAKDMQALQSGWYLYLKNLKMAQNFHMTLGTYYFPETYAHFGADGKHPAWNKIDWILKAFQNKTGQFSPKASEDVTANLRLSTDNRINYLTLNNTQTAGKIAYQPLYGPAVIGADYGGDAYHAAMASQDDSGDGTVPTHSADAVTRHIKFSARLSGFEHSASYNDKSARAITLHSILSLAKSAKSLC
ncbi:MULTISPECIES: alpha/beta fold hydrolase [Pseudomonas]|uniref:alpha/beta fold hydrolase n=1 Tax=Pseudomonas TaxID=286 RepID=UPI001F22EA2B|nr:alpha/beta hydrolase [Pseudomonas faucium]